jgi:hypothetical protein
LLAGPGSNGAASQYRVQVTLTTCAAGLNRLARFSCSPPPNRAENSNNFVMPAKRKIAPQRGIYERIKGSGIWWIRWTDSKGHKRREKAGSHGVAEKLLLNRQAEKLKGVKLPDNLRAKSITFGALCDDALKHSAAENSAKQTYELGLRMEQLRPVFGSRPAESIRKNEIVEWLTEQAEEREWAATTRNRWQATFSLIFRVGLDNEKIEKNPAARIRRKTEGNGRVRFLSEP